MATTMPAAPITMKAVRQPNASATGPPIRLADSVPAVTPIA